MLWLIGGFIFCPCHLPLTHWLIGSLLAGPASGAVFREHLHLAGGVVTLVWVLATWRGLSGCSALRRVASFRLATCRPQDKGRQNEETNEGEREHRQQPPLRPQRWCGAGCVGRAIYFFLITHAQNRATRDGERPAPSRAYAVGRARTTGTTIIPTATSSANKLIIFPRAYSGESKFRRTSRAPAGRSTLNNV